MWMVGACALSYSVPFFINYDMLTWAHGTGASTDIPSAFIHTFSSALLAFVSM